LYDGAYSTTSSNGTAMLGAVLRERASCLAHGWHVLRALPVLCGHVRVDQQKARRMVYMVGCPLNSKSCWCVTRGSRQRRHQRISVICSFKRRSRALVSLCRTPVLAMNITTRYRDSTYIATHSPTRSVRPPESHIGILEQASGEDR
jgi:hypothetical protein